MVVVAETLDVRYSRIMELSSDGGSPMLRAGIGWSTRYEQQVTTSDTLPALAAGILTRQQPVIVEDWQHEKRFTQPALLRDHGVISSLNVAIHKSDHLWGILSVDSQVRRSFTDCDIDFLRAVANLLAMVVERDQATEALDRLVRKRTHEPEWPAQDGWSPDPPLPTVMARLVAAAQSQAVREERQRLARDLHDSVTQALYGVTLHAEAATRLLASGDVITAAQFVRELQEIAQDAFEEMRLLIFELRPPVLEQEGLVAALRARLDAVEGRTTLQTAFVVEGVDLLPTPVEHTLYRIAQEALNNALKHAHAQHIAVSLCQEASSVILEIVDDGVGFDPDTARETGGLGLRGMEERVAQLGGRLDLFTAPGAGTKVRTEVAL